MGMSSSIALFMQNPYIAWHVWDIAVNYAVDGSSQTSVMSNEQVVETNSFGVSIGPSKSNEGNKTSTGAGWNAGGWVWGWWAVWP
jgi:hypothetical protein